MPELYYCVTARLFTSNVGAESIDLHPAVAETLFPLVEKTGESECEELEILKGVGSGLRVKSSTTRKAYTTSQSGYMNRTD